MKQRGRRGSLVVVMVAVLLAATALPRGTGRSARAATLAPAAADATVTVTDQIIGVTQLQLGATHTQHSLDSGGTKETVDRAQEVLRSAVVMQNQHIMGWGALSPEPVPTVMDWQTLDRRVAIMRSSTSRPVITLCCAPDWMRNGLSGSTDWSDLTLAPTPDHYEDFANLAARVAQRYPDVRDFQVWNELKGFWDRGSNNWDIAGYTALYNAVYQRVKEARPDARIGGPYVPVQSFATESVASHPSQLSGPWGVIDQRSLDAIDYFLAHATGADFIAIDGSTAVRTGEITTDPFTANDKLAAVTAWIRARTTLPIWWSEYYVQPEHARWSPEQQAAVHADALLRLAASGASAAFIWQPQAVGDSGAARAVLWSDIREPGGGRATPTAKMFATVGQSLTPGASLRRVDVAGDVSALSTVDTLILVNRKARPQSVQVNNVRFNMRAYEVLTARVRRR